MERILVNHDATVTVVFTDDGGVPADPVPAEATVTVTRMDGTPLVTDAATIHDGVGTFVYILLAGEVPNLETLTLDWTSAVGTVRTIVEVVGGFLFGLDELRAQETKLADVARYPASVLADARILVEDAIEHATRVAFVPRARSEVVNGDGSEWLWLSRNEVRAVRSAVSLGVALDITGVVPASGPRIYNPLRWPLGWRNIAVTYEHGYDGPPPRVSRAALILARVWLLSGPIDDRATQLSTATGGVVNLATPGVFGATFGVPEVDAVVREYAYPEPAML